MTAALDALGVRLPTPGWAVLDAIRERRFTGQLTLIGVPPTKLWADQGRIYRAEPLGAPPIAARLVVSGGLTADDLARGVVRVGGREHLGALFERAPLADRHSILLALATMTEEALRAVAGQDIAAATIEAYVFDPDGVHLWATASAPPVAAAPVRSWTTVPTAPAAPVAPMPAPPPTPASTAAPAAPVFDAPAPAPPPPPPGPAGGPSPAATTLTAPPADAVPAPAPRPAEAAPTLDWDRIPFLDRLNEEALPNGVRHGAGVARVAPSVPEPTHAAPPTPAPRTNGHAAPAPAPVPQPEPERPNSFGDDLDTTFAVIWPDGDRRPTADDVVTTPRTPNPLAELSVGARGRLFDDRFAPDDE